MNCNICGNSSGYYPLCRDCNELKEQGKVEKCEDCGTWFKKEEKHNCGTKGKDTETPDDNGCTVCGDDSKGKPLCLACYKDKERLKKELESSRTPEEIKEHYFNQKRVLFKVENPEYTKTGTLKLLALAEDLATFHSDFYLKKRVVKDINALQKTQIGGDTFEKPSFDDEDFRKQFPAEDQCEDGHYVRSYSEMLIDNWLYNRGILHAYEKSVFMPSDPEAVVLSDFYLPDGDVYIEFWGLNDDEKYLARKEKKMKLYEENNIKVIHLEEKHIKRLNDTMPRKLHEYIQIRV